MKDFYKWADDKWQITLAVLILSGLTLWLSPTSFNFDLVVGGMFGMVVGYAMNKAGGIK